MGNDRMYRRNFAEDWFDTLDRIAARVLVIGLVLLVMSAISAHAQQVPDELTLGEGVELAKADNPTCLGPQHDPSAADGQVREA